MELKTIPYNDYEALVPQSGRHIIGQERGENIIVYQAFNPKTSDFAVTHQRFGGKHYKYTRMSWIKPNFLWMMYRAGWASKEHEQRVLAIEIPKTSFEEVLGEAVHSVFIEEVYGTEAKWKSALADSEVRIQWDPDHDPYGNKLDRRAIQLGLRGSMLRNFGMEWIQSIEDITPFVHEQKAILDTGDLSALQVIEEKKVAFDMERLAHLILD